VAAAGADLPELLSQPPAGAPVDVGTGAPAGAGKSGDQTAPAVGRPIGPWAFTGVAIASFGGPLALAALSAPGVVADASESAGLAMIAALVVFTVPLAIWLRYGRQVNSSGGLYSFVEAAAGRKVALVQGAVWIVSYLLYLAYTTVQIVYDVLPAALPGERSYQTLLTLGIPLAIAAVMIAGRAAALIVIGLMAVGQLALAGILDGVTLAHVSTPASSFGAGASAGSLAKAGAQTSLLYVCGSLPLFLGGEVARPVRTIRRGLLGSYLVTGLVVTLAVAPLAASPGLLQTEIPGVTVAQEFASTGLANAIGIGVAVSIAGVMLCEYLALTRLVGTIGSWRLRPVTLAIGAVLVLAAPLSLIDPGGFYDSLLKPSLIALWLSQLIVFLVYPLFIRKQRGRMLPAWMLGGAASAFAVYGLWTTLQQATT
jgi:amino acid transporter